MSVFSIYIANFLLLTCYTITLWIISITSSKLRNMRLLAWAYTAALIAVLVGLAGRYPHKWIAHTVSPELLIISFLLLHYTFLGYVGRKPMWRWTPPAILALGLVGFLYCSLHVDHYLLRAELTAAILGLQALVCAFLLFRYAPPDIKAPTRTTAVIFMLFGLRGVMRCVWIAHYHIMPERLPGMGYAIAGVSAFLILNAFTPLGYLWMETTRLQKDMERLSATDSLTGTLNRRAFDELGLVEMERAVRHSLPLAVIALDVDHFKKVNDSFGHSGGDRALVEVAETVRNILRSADVLARVGGDEFVILLPNTSLEGARELAGRLRDRVASLEIELRNGRVPVAASFGIAAMGVHPLGATSVENWERILERADAALYRAKASGRNRVES